MLAMAVYVLSGAHRPGAGTHKLFEGIPKHNCLKVAVINANT